MLPVIAAEALHFLSRRDLDKACAVSKYIDAMIAKCFDVYPLRPVASILLWWDELMPKFPIDDNEFPRPERSFSSMDDAAHFVGSVLHHSYVERLQVTYDY